MKEKRIFSVINVDQNGNAKIIIATRLTAGEISFSTIDNPVTDGQGVEVIIRPRDPYQAEAIIHEESK